jgi:hypothetical protein
MTEPETFVGAGALIAEFNRHRFEDYPYPALMGVGSDHPVTNKRLHCLPNEEGRDRAVC